MTLVFSFSQLRLLFTPWVFTFAHPWLLFSPWIFPFDLLSFSVFSSLSWKFSPWFFLLPIQPWVASTQQGRVPHCLFSRWVTLHKMVSDFRNQFLTPFLMLSQMEPFFLLPMAPYKSSRGRLLIGSLYYFHQSGDGYLGCHREQNGWHHLKKHWKPAQKLVSNVTYHLVEGHMSRKQTVFNWRLPFKGH